MGQLIEDVNSETNVSDFYGEAVELPSDLLIEILPTSRTRAQYVPINKFPFTIGRAYDNDLILSDETVSPHHLVVGEGNELTIRDLNSDNGTYFEKHLLGTDSAAITIPCTYTVGRTKIRLLSKKTVVVQTQQLTKLGKITELASDLRVAICLLFFYLLINIYYALESQSLWMDWGAVVVGQFFELISPLVIATVFSFISHQLTHKWRFSLHLSIACVAFIVQQFIGEVAEFLSYFLTSDNAGYGVSIIVGGVVFSAVLAWQMRALSHLSVARSNWIGAAIVMPLYAMIVLQASLLAPDYIYQPKMHNVLRSNDIRVEKTITSIPELRTVIESELQIGLKESLEEKN